MAGVQTAWGVDVGVSSLKAIKLRRDGERVTIEAFDVIEHDKFLTEEGADRDALIRSTLQKFVAKNGIRSDVVFIGVPGSTTFARFVKLPPVETKKIPEIVRFEAIQQIPFPLDQVNWDYHTFQHPDSPDVEVGIFAMKKELVAQIMSNFRAANLNVQGVQMSPLAVYNAAAYDGMTGEKGTVVIDMGAEHTDIVIMDQGRVWLRSISIGGNNFTEALAKSFKQQFTKAEKLKKEAATSKYQKQIYQAMRPIFADLVAEIQRSLGAYNSSHRDSRLEHVLVMGNPFKLPNLQKYLQQELKMDVTRLETFKQANIEKAAAFSENILSMSTAYGLAIQALGQATIDTNLLPTEIARAMMWKKKQPWFIAAAALIVLGCVANIGRYYMDRSAFAASQDSDEHAANAKMAAMHASLISQWNSVSNNFDQAAQQARDQTAMVAARRIWPSIVSDIYKSAQEVDDAATKRSNVHGPTVVITDVSSRYSATLSTESIKVDDTATTPGGMGGMPGGAPAGQPAGTANGAAPTTKPAGDHGFVVTIRGYLRSGQNIDATNLHDYLAAKSQPPAAVAASQPANSTELPAKLYYYEYNRSGIGGHPISAAAGGAFGGPVGGGGASGDPDEQPWSKPGGLYGEVFFTDLTGITPSTQPRPGMMGAQPSAETYPDRLELVGTQLSRQQVSMGQLRTFKINIKVHIRDEVK